MGWKTRSHNAQQITDFKMNRGCIVCGYCRCSGALQLHHRDPSRKGGNRNFFRRGETDNISRMGREKADAELEKCIVVCATCHAEIHGGLHPEYLVGTEVDDLGQPVQLELGFIF